MIWAPASGDPGRVANRQGWEPADYVDLNTFRQNQPLLASSPGPLYILAVLGKEAEWRNGVAVAWEALPGSTKALLPLLGSRVTSEDADTMRAARAVHKVCACGTCGEVLTRIPYWPSRSSQTAGLSTSFKPQQVSQ